MSLRVLRTNGHALIQDLGRPGYAAIGVGRAGAWDASALRAGNAMLGNALAAAGVELPLGKLSVQAQDSVRLAITGSPAPVSIDGHEVAFGSVLTLPAGSRLEVGQPAGLRCYLCVRGGIAVEPVLGSRSRDTLAGIGPEPVQEGDLLPIGSERAVTGPVADAPGRDDAGRSRGTVYMLDAECGPRADWFTPAGRETLFTGRYTVTDRADRVGIRLAGEPLQRRGTDELASEPVVAGSIQVPADGQPLIFGPDHPITGGYPVIAVLTAAARDACAYLRPGQTIRFRRAGSWPR